MNVILTIGNKEAIPVRALAYVSNWVADPDEIVHACATPPTKKVGSSSIRNRRALPAYLVSWSAYRPMSSVEWEPFIVALGCLEKGLKADERTDNENWERCRKQAVLQLPDGAFVWLDEFQRWFSNTRPLKEAATLSNDGEDDSFENESDSLNLDPFIPPEFRDAIFSGLERYLVADREAAVEDATEGGIDGKQATVVTAKPKSGRPKTIYRKACILRQLIDHMAKGKGIEPENLPGTAANLLDACQRIEESKTGKKSTFSTSEDTFKTWLKYSGYGFKGGRAPKDEAHFWTRLCVETMGLMDEDIFTEVIDKTAP